MKLAWLCYVGSPDDHEPVTIEVHFTKPEPWMYYRVVPIVYTEIQHD